MRLSVIQTGGCIDVKIATYISNPSGTIYNDSKGGLRGGPLERILHVFFNL